MEDAEVLLVAGDGHGASAPVELIQHGDVFVAEQQRAQAGGEAEHFVEGQRDEVGVIERKIQAVCRNERSGVQQHHPLVSLGGSAGAGTGTSWK